MEKFATFETTSAGNVPARKRSYRSSRRRWGVVPVMSGALTPTEVFRAHQLGSDVVKLFPGSAVGPDYVKALQGPFPHIPIMPTGGVDENNVGAWFKAGVFAVGAGSQLSPAKMAKEGRFEEITAVATRFAAAVEAAKATAGRT